MPSTGRPLSRSGWTMPIWNGTRLDFDLMQRRLVNLGKRAMALAAQHPASFMVFDVLAHEGDLRARTLTQRRQVLEALADGWSPPLQLSPMTDDAELARQWFVDYRPAGIAGLVIKGSAQPYRPGRREWVKVKSRETQEVIIGAVTGPITRPETIVAGLLRDGELIIVGRSVLLSRAQAASLDKVLEPGPPQHPWPDEVSSSRFGSCRDRVKLTKVEPSMVAEVLADTALQAGVPAPASACIVARRRSGAACINGVTGCDGPRACSGRARRSCR